MLNLFKSKSRWVVLLMLLMSCKLPSVVKKTTTLPLPAVYTDSSVAGDSVNTGMQSWRLLFTDPYLTAMIDSALQHNQELLITLQDVIMARNDIRVSKGRLLPFVDAGSGAAVEKTARYTSQGAGDASTEMKPGVEIPEWLPDYRLALSASWEADIWKKLRNEKAATVNHYLATVEGRNFVITNLVAEIAENYYELIALDYQLDIIRKNIGLQQNALDIVRVQKQAARVTELAVRKFSAELLHSQGLEYEVLQKIKACENRLNFLMGRYPQPVQRSGIRLLDEMPAIVQTGIPSQLLANRPDIRQAEFEVQAANLDLKAARADFFPRLDISASLGINAFKPGYLLTLPESMLFSMAGDLAGPLVNKNAIKAAYANANARQLQALYEYDKTLINSFSEVFTQLTAVQNIGKVYTYQQQQVDSLMDAVNIANDLFRAARADYLEVLMTQRDALDAKLDLIETRLKQYQVMTQLYRSLGGGWK